jgi:hypothetical protein
MIWAFAAPSYSPDTAMSPTRSIFESYSRAHAQDFSDNLMALPSSGTLLARIKTAFSNWVQASVQAQAESRLWDSAQADPRIMAELVQARVGPEQAAPAPAVTPVPASSSMPLSAGSGGLMERAYQSRFHSNGAQPA